MSSQPATGQPVQGPPAAAAAFARRRAAGLRLVDEAEALARACHDIARRFHAGGKLIAFGDGSGATDAQHVAVEFVHPVLVGKRALPAVSLTNDVATLTGIAAGEGWDEVFARQLRHLARPADIAMGLGGHARRGSVGRGLAVARELGLLTVALGSDPGEGGGAADHCLLVQPVDPLVAKELRVTAYHLLWELVHVFLEHPGVLDAGAERAP